MILYPKHYMIQPEAGQANAAQHDGLASDGADEALTQERQASEQAYVIAQADRILGMPVPHITDVISPRSTGGPHDFFSEGDYWWPNPDTADGLPYIRRDGETNPDNFNHHRNLLRRMRDQVAILSRAYQISGRESYAGKACQILDEFFLAEDTCMTPNLNYAQAIAGVCPGRGIGVIDTIHLTDIPFAVQALLSSSSLSGQLLLGLKAWFAAYLDWMLTSPNGIDEMNTHNNHSVCFFMQAAVFALFTDNEEVLSFCRGQFRSRLIPQMAADGSFPLELARTKPYNYSAFILDNMVTLCHILSTPGDNLWQYRSPEGYSIKKALDFMAPYVLDKSTWPYPRDVMHFDSFPVRYSFLIFAGCTLGRQEYIDFFYSLPKASKDEEAQRNLAVNQPLLWM